MTRIRTLALAGLALVAAGPALAFDRGPVSQLDNATQMQDDLFLYQRTNGIGPVASPLGVPATTASIGAERGAVAQLDNATQMQDDLFRYQRLNGIGPVASPVEFGVPATTASISTGPAPFWANHEAIRLQADNN